MSDSITEPDVLATTPPEDQSPLGHLDFTHNLPAAPRIPEKPVDEDFLSRLGDVYDSGVWMSQMRAGERALAPWDPSFQLTDKAFERASVDIPSEFWPAFNDAHSDDGLQLIRGQILTQIERQKRLSSMGTLAGLGYGAIATAGDPSTYFLAAMTGGLGEAAGLTALPGRIGAFVRSGIIGGVTNAEMSAITESEFGSPTFKDLLHAGMGGLILAPLGALAHGAGAEAARAGTFLSPQDAALRDEAMSLRRTIEFDGLTSTLGRDRVDQLLTDQGRTYFREQLKPIESTWRGWLSKEEPAPTLPLEAQQGEQAHYQDIANRDAFRFGRPLPFPERYETAEQRFYQDVANNRAKLLGEPTPFPSLQPTEHEAEATLAKRLAVEQVSSPEGHATPLEELLNRRRALPPPPPPEPGAPAPKPPEPPLHAIGAASPGSISTTMERPPGWRPGDPDFTNTSDFKGAMAGSRISMVGQLVQSEVPEIRKAARTLGEDVLPAKDGSPVTDSGSELVQRAHSTRMAAYAEEAQPHVQDWMNRNDPGWFGRRKALAQLREAVYRAGIGEHTDDPAIRALADIDSKYYGDSFNKAKRTGVPGFDTIPESKTYRPVHWLQSKIEAMTAKWGAANVEKLMTGAVLPLHPEFTPDLANRIAVGMLKNIAKIGQTSDIVRELALTADKPELLKQVLTEAGVPQGTIDDAVYAVTPKPDQTGKVAPARTRTAMDHLYSINATDANGEPGTFRLTDLLDTDNVNLVNRYSRQIEGASVKAAILRAFARSGTDQIPSLPALWERLRQRAVELGMDPKDAADQTGKLATMGKWVEGAPLWPSTAMGETLGVIRKWQSATRLGLATFAHANNMATIVGEAGFANMLRITPAVTQMFRAVANTPALFRELYAATGFGSEPLRTELLGRILPEDLAGDQPIIPKLGSGGPVKQAATKGVQALSGGLDRANMLQARWTAFAPLMSFMQRTSLLANAQMWGTIAKSGKLPGIRRLATMGLDEGMAGRIIGEINANAEYGPGGTLNAFNLDKWDPEVRANYVTALDKWSRRVAQTPDIGQMSQWMTKDWGKSLIQFRLYHIAAYEKQLLHGLYTHDVTTFRNWSLTMMGGAMAYAAREYLASIGDPNRDEILSRRLSPGALAKAAVARAGFLSLLPIAVDAGGAWSKQYAPPFSGSRSTGLENDPLYGNPTFDFLNNVTHKIPAAIFDAARTDRHVTRDDAAAVRGLVPFQNSLGLKNVLDAYQGTLPKKSGG